MSERWSTSTETPPSMTGIKCAWAMKLRTSRATGRSTQLNRTSQSKAASKAGFSCTDIERGTTSKGSAVACEAIADAATSTFGFPMSSGSAWSRRSKLCSSTLSGSIRVTWPMPMRATASAMRQPTLPSPTIPTFRRAMSFWRAGPQVSNDLLRMFPSWWRRNQVVIEVKTVRLGTDDSGLAAPVTVHARIVFLPESCAPGAVNSGRQTDERESSCSSWVCQDISFRSCIGVAHVLPACPGDGCA